ncbi:MAG TPA: phenylalanine--tRNA ligase subunit beta [Acidimicrobiales bacterium]|nr:phenylalanine--tRNA ligase subunit beta [Acidimicrobiales bacterium]
MRTPLSWLRDFAPFEGDPAVLVAALDDLGLVVEAVEHVGQGLEEVVVARVEEIEAIPGADRIRKVVVEAGQGPVEIVCGAFNFAVGDLVPLAPVGATLPDGTKIAKRPFRGVESNGMLCSGRELGLSDDAEGILKLTRTEGAHPGQPFTEAYGIEPDVVFDITVEGNRPDAHAIAGVARDLAARLGLTFALPEPAVPAPSGPVAETLASVVVEDLDLCPRFTARVLTGVTVGTSPRWLVRRLELAGMRPINNVVDASNYVMLELGQPTHPYDLDRLPGHGLRVRRARPGEVLETLDGVARELGVPGRGLGDTGEDCLICDAEGNPVGIGGIMGGSSSEISDDTTRVLLEAAYFAPMAIARTSKRLGLRTEASARFERGCDPWGIDRAADRFCELLALAEPPVTLAPGVLDVRGEVPGPLRFGVPVAAVNRLLGTDLDAATIADLLEPIGFGSEPGIDEVVVTVPTNRPDVRPEPHGVADVTEEVARLYGYSRIVRRRPSWPQVGGRDARQEQRRLVREVLAGLGADEAWTPTFVADADHAAMGLGGPAVKVANPLAADEAWLRRSQLPGLLRTVVYNTDRRQGSVRFFEIGTVFSHPDEGRARVERSGSGGGEPARLPEEREMLSVVMAEDGDDARTAVVGWRVLEAALRLADVRTVAPGAPAGDGAAPLAPVPGLHPTRSAWLVAESDGTVLGSVGEVDPAVAEAFGAGPIGSRRIGWLEVDLGLLVDAPRRPTGSRPVSRFPSADVDLALAVDDLVPADAVARALERAGGELLESVVLFDVYRGPAVGEGRRSLAFRLRFCADDRTLTDAEVAGLRQGCIDAAVAEVGAELR